MENFNLNKNNRLIAIIFFIVILSLPFFSREKELNASRKDVELSNIEINAFYYSFLDNLLGVTYAIQEGWKIEGTTTTSDLNGNSYFSGIIYTGFGVNSAIFLGKLNATKKIVWMHQWSFFTKNIVKDIIFIAILLVIAIALALAANFIRYNEENAIKRETEVIHQHMERLKNKKIAIK